MTTKKAAKKGAVKKGKKLARVKKMSEVKPLAVDAFLQFNS